MDSLVQTCSLPFFCNLVIAIQPSIIWRSLDSSTIEMFGLNRSQANIERYDEH
jgi:hypothetical protein